MTLFATILDCTFNLQLFSIALLQEAVIYCVRHQCGQPNVNLRQVPAQVND